MEIERKFLARDVPELQAPGVAIKQGYLVLAPRAEIRVRRAGDQSTLTVKGGKGMARDEIETRINREMFDSLWPLTEGRRLEKSRQAVSLPDGLQAEVDTYRGDLEGLQVIEVEFSSEAEARVFQPPAWFGWELTGDPAWSNARLAVDGPPF